MLSDSVQRRFQKVTSVVFAQIQEQLFHCRSLDLSPLIIQLVCVRSELLLISDCENIFLMKSSRICAEEFSFVMLRLTTYDYNPRLS